MARNDAVGMFWEDAVITGRGVKIDRPMPPIPDTGWRPPEYFPDLSTAPVISIDCETFDPDLIDLGPGWARGRGHLVGVSVGAPGGYRWYFPMRHEVEPQDNLPPEAVLAWLRKTLVNPAQPKVGANILYDVGWLRQEGVEVLGELVDVQYAEALLDERAEVALEVMAQKYLGEGKQSSLLYQWCSDYYGGKAGGNQRANIYRTPPRLTGPYAESDADLPLRLATVLYPLLEEQGLGQLFKMECGLIPLMISMRFAGVTVDIPKAERLRDTLKEREKLEQEKLDKQAGFHVDINTSASMAKAFDAIGLKHGKTAKGAPSFTKDFLKTIEHPLADQIREIRKLNKLRGTFVESYILDSHINGKVYGQFHLLRSDDGGTRSGRFSSSTPNLQNLPSRDEELAPLVRGIFVPDEGHRFWRKYDYSQIEYRFLIHYAIGPGSDDARARFNADPDTDYHEWTLDLIAPMAHWDISTPAKRKPYRKPTKNVNFGMIYGMGEPKLASQLGLSKKESSVFFRAYDKGVPFAKPTMKATMEEAQRLGIITTILGRRSRFDLWEPTAWGENSIALPYEKAILQYGQMQRAHTHKALNRRLQGSAADLMKMAMWKCWTSGVFDATGVPRLTVHDENDFSDPGGRDDAFLEMRHIMETAIPLRLPIRADCDIGPNWGHVEKLK
jgi:DNA polymerase I-like protein with 3'-5' exonuclease and polymerase domains